MKRKNRGPLGRGFLLIATGRERQYLGYTYYFWINVSHAMAKSSRFLSKLKTSLLGKSEKTEESTAGKFAPKKEEPLDVKFVQTFT